MELLNNIFWKYFKEISNIPRKSGNEEKIAQYLVNFATDKGFKYYTDDMYNVVIWKDAYNGYENKDVLGLQCHTDMICEKKDNSHHDFLKDPICLKIDGDFIKATDTTLGADNGIGVAYILAILASEDIKTPPLECIFTTQEETTMNGVNFLDANILKSKRIISFDNFSEDEMWISSATAKEWKSVIHSEKIELENEEICSFSLKLSHFKGGHSGLDIGDSKRGNPIKIVGNLLNNFSDIYLASFTGGSQVNIIPRDCEITFSINKHELDKISLLKTEIENLQKLFPQADISFNRTTNITNCYNKESTEKILNFINEFSNGSLKRDKYENVILSGNFATVNTVSNDIYLTYSIRYNSKDIGEQLEKDIQNIMQKYDVQEIELLHILGYEQDENSSLIKNCEDLYLKVFNKPIKKIRVQACLECGYFSYKIPNLQYIAIAPNIYDAHSPSERMSITSANKMWDFIKKLLENIN